MRTLLAISLFANFLGVAAAVYIVEGRGGFAYIESYLSHAPKAIDQAAAARNQMLESLPIPETPPVVFLGDSITAGCEWHELLNSPGVLNRGIGGDTSAGVLARIPGILRLRPAKIFLMIGANDAQALGYSPGMEFKEQRKIVMSLLANPAVRIYVQSILPSRNARFSRWGSEANRLLKTLQSSRVEFIDLRPAFEDHDGLIRPELTSDGLHLSAQGYRLWAAAIRGFI
ncbi:MAG TPA: GDSL-type esterase/lipase family protein [Bryobacteraceae bacterium]|nr:GDSL-type esterase/lipase family protein [Bryobacteraceae bacterium]